MTSAPASDARAAGTWRIRRGDERPDGEVRADEQRHNPRTPTGTSASHDRREAPGSIIAAIIDTHTATKNESEPRRVATPVRHPFISRTETIQHAAARPSVAAAAPAVIGSERSSGADRQRVRSCRERLCDERRILPFELLGRSPRQLSASDADTGYGKMSSSPFSTPSKIARATDAGEAFGISKPRVISVSVGPVRTAWTVTPRPAKRARSDCVRLTPPP